jgi:hypothetical protein
MPFRGSPQTSHALLFSSCKYKKKIKKIKNKNSTSVQDGGRRPDSKRVRKLQVQKKIKK